LKALVCIYNPADLFPPTLNAVRLLAGEFDDVLLITNRQDDEMPANFPPNVRVQYVLDNMKGQRSAVANMLRFLRFTLAVRKVLSQTRFHVALMYDPHAWLSVVTARRLFSNAPRVKWYHNHDIYELSTQRRFSAGWFAVKQEAKHFDELDIFSLPSNERKQYFPIDKLKGEYFFIPNYPSAAFMEKFPKARPSKEFINLIHQGRISEGQGLEPVIELLSTVVNGKQLKLVLKGFIQPSYKATLEELARSKGVAHQLVFHGPSAYSEVPRIASGCQIGLAIHQKAGIMSATLGTSSNKIYEYAALGLPVILLDTPHFREHLERYSWAYFTDCSTASLLKCIGSIDKNHDALSESAQHDFKTHLNFEVYFRPAITYCKQALKGA
jgi:glycosyltransferase involved in cell wall biosynthesis